MKKTLVLVLVVLCAASTIMTLRPIRLARAVVPGDINGDGVVDISDAILASHAFGSATGNPDYNPAADLNSDGYIDIFDMLMLAKNFGQTGSLKKPSCRLAFAGLYPPFFESGKQRFFIPLETF